MKLCEIFKGGIQKDSNGYERNYSDEDLDNICQNFKTQNPDVPICIGHPKQTAPAYGWVNSLQRIGHSLYCDFKQVQKEFKTAVNSGLFKTRSVCIDLDKMQLKHVAFLGAAAPAIKGMEQFTFAETLKNNIFEFDSLEKYEFEEEKNIEFSEKLQAKDEEIKKLKEQLLNNQKEIKKQKAENLTKEYIQSGNILPSQRETVSSIFEECSRYSEFEESNKLLENFKNFISSLHQIEFSEIASPENVSKATCKQEPLTGEDFSKVIKDTISEYAENGVTLTETQALKIYKTKA